MDSSILLIIIIFYFIVLFLVSYISGKKSNNQGFFIGNRKSRWYIVAFAMIGANLSGVTFVSVPGMVGTNCFSYLQMVLGFIVGQLIIAYILSPLYYRMNLISIYGYLENRFGPSSHKTGAWFFFISKILGAAVRLFLVCLILQMLVFESLHISFGVNVAISIFVVWLYTFQGGVKSLIWTDSLKTLCLIISVVLCIYYIASSMHLNFNGICSTIYHSSLSRIFFFDDVNSKQYFFKQFLAGIFTMIAMNGLDQDMMQRNLSCRNIKESQINLLISILLQFIVITMFLMLGVLLFMYTSQNGIQNPAKSDELFPMIATGGYFPTIVGILFIVGLVSAAFSNAGSALTALTTSFTIDILKTNNKSDNQITRIRKYVHIVMAILMGLTIIIIDIFNNTSVIDAVYILVSYTYGPILGLFAFGILCKRRVRDIYIPYIAITAPILCFILQKNSEKWFSGYSFSYELLIFNALFVYIGLWIVSIGQGRIKQLKETI